MTAISSSTFVSLPVRVAHSSPDRGRLDDRPRKTLGFMKPSEKLTELTPVEPAESITRLLWRQDLVHVNILVAPGCAERTSTLPRRIEEP